MNRKALVLSFFAQGRVLVGDISWSDVQRWFSEKLKSAI